jgi:Glucose / Sorbosone dehydrogenase
MSLFGITEQGFTPNKIGSRPEIWTYGLRNPYMFYFDQKSGDLFIADAGQNHWEEINYQPASSKGGENYGWKFNEGSYCHPAMSTEKSARSSGFCPLPNILIQRRSRTERKPTMALLVAGAWRRQLWRPDQNLSGWRRVFGPPVWRGLGR